MPDSRSRSVHQNAVEVVMKPSLPAGPQRGKENERGKQIWNSAIFPRVVLVAMCFVSCAGLAQSRLQFESAQSRYTSLQSGPANLKAQASPTLIFAGSPTRITVHVQLPNTNVRGVSITLYRMASHANQPIAELHSEGKGNIYSGEAILDESRVGAVVLEVAASVSAADWITLFANRETLLSNPITINVMAQEQPERQEGEAPLTTISRRGTSGFAWSMFTVAIVAFGAISTTSWLLLRLRRSKPTATPQFSKPLKRTSLLGKEVVVTNKN